MFVLNTLAPIFLLIFLGAMLRRYKFVSSNLFNETNRLVYFVALPSLLFAKTAQARIESDAAVRMFLVLAGGMMACVMLGYLVAWILRVPGPSVGAFVQGAFRGNLVYIGLTVVLFALATSDGTPDPQAEALAVLAIAPLIPAYNVAAVLVLLAKRETGKARVRRRLVELTRKVITNPLLLACAAGFAYSLTGWELPMLARRTFATLGQMSLPLALLSIGGSLTVTALGNRLTHALASALIKVAGAPLVGYVIARRIGLTPTELRVVMIYLASPAAVSSFVMAQQMGGDEALAGDIVLISTLLSIASLALALLAR